MGDVVTPGYAPPEQYDNGDQGPWTDIYSIGATLYWMITGAKPPAAPARAAGTPMPSARAAGMGRFGEAFLDAVDWALALAPHERRTSARKTCRHSHADFSPNTQAAWRCTTRCAMKMAIAMPAWPSKACTCCSIRRVCSSGARCCWRDPCSIQAGGRWWSR